MKNCSNGNLKFPSFIDIPIELCGRSSPLRVSLQASAPDILIILLRHGANPIPLDGGSSTVLALMDKLLEYEDSKSFPYQLVSCLRIIILSISCIEMPFKVSWIPFLGYRCHFLFLISLLLIAIVVRHEKANVLAEILNIVDAESCSIE